MAGRDFLGGRDLDEFAAVSAPGDFDGDGYTDLAVANRPSGKIRAPARRGAGHVTDPDRAHAARSQVLECRDPGVPGSSAMEEDEFAASLVAGNFGRGPQDDLAIGDPAYRNRRGAATVLYGSAAGLSVAG